MKFKCSLSLLLPSILLLAMGTANASTYDFSLISTIGPSGGKGSLAVNGSIGSGLTTFTEGGTLNSLNFQIANYSFSLDNDLTKASVTFNNGSLTSIIYVGAKDGFKLDLDTGKLGYIFTDFINPGLSSVGTISSPGVSATPLPPSWTLMLFGLVGAGFLLRGTKKAQIVATV